MLRRATLMRALTRNRSPSAQAAELDALAVVAHGYWQVIAGLLAATAALLPAVQPVGGRRDER